MKILDEIEISSFDGFYEAQFHLYQELEITFQYIGTLDDENKFHGYAVLKILPNQFCYRGVCDSVKYETLRGSFKHGVLEGLISITSNDDQLITFTTVKEGIVHGMVMTYGIGELYLSFVRKMVLVKYQSQSEAIKVML